MSDLQTLANSMLAHAPALTLAIGAAVALGILVVIVMLAWPRKPLHDPVAEQRMAELNARVQTMGGVIKDPQTGLVDFYGRVGEKLVWLCWRYGEDTLGYYHDLKAGYSGRRPLSADVRRKLVN